MVTDEDIAPPADGPPRPAADMVRARATARVARQREDAQAFERREPLSRRILEALAEGPTLPRDLAGLVGAAPESVSRVLASLLKEGLVQVSEVEGDKRKRLYALTREGEARLSRQRAFGAPAAPPRPPTSEETLTFMRAAVRNAVRMRRETNGLEDAGDRLRVVVDEARRLKVHELELEAMAELVTTLRQERRIEAMDALLGTLQEISLGQHPNRDPALALPAAAHREYTLGRLPEMHGGGGPCVRARHLDAAQSLFGQRTTCESDPSSRMRSRLRAGQCGCSANWKTRTDSLAACSCTASVSD
jgi:DNA-binding MarR family transcriptional regulator